MQCFGFFAFVNSWTKPVVVLYKRRAKKMSSPFGCRILRYAQMTEAMEAVAVMTLGFGPRDDFHESF